MCACVVHEMESRVRPLRRGRMCLFSFFAQELCALLYAGAYYNVNVLHFCLPIIYLQMMCCAVATCCMCTFTNAFLSARHDNICIGAFYKFNISVELFCLIF